MDKKFALIQYFLLTVLKKQKKKKTVLVLRSQSLLALIKTWAVKAPTPYSDVKVIKSSSK